jgi:uncharacterized membrane protein YjjB (DUF3815 family)
MSILIQLLSALLGSLGFGLVFNVHGRKLLFAAAGGFLCWGSYLALSAGGLGDFEAAFLASVAVFLYSELCARLLRAPVTVFSAVAAIPLIPGAGLYRTMDALMQRNYAVFMSEGMYTLLFAVSMSAGIVAAAAAFTLAGKLCRKRSIS